MSRARKTLNTATYLKMALPKYQYRCWGVPSPSSSWPQKPSPNPHITPGLGLHTTKASLNQNLVSAVGLGLADPRRSMPQRVSCFVGSTNAVRYTRLTAEMIFRTITHRQKLQIGKRYKDSKIGLTQLSNRKYQPKILLN